MAIGSSTFSNLGGAVSDLFAGMGAQTAANMKAQGLRINAQGQLITAQGTIISAQGTELSAESLRIKAGGDLAEATNILAQQTQDAGKQAATGDYIGAAMKGVAAVATLFDPAPSVPIKSPSVGDPTNISSLI